MADPPWARVVVYPGDDPGAACRAVDAARTADVLVKASGVGVFDDLLEAAVASLRGPGRTVAFWDVDAPATLERLARDPADPLRSLLPSFDLVFTYGGGPPVVAAYGSLGAARCVPIYNALDPTTHHPVPPDLRFDADLLFIGNRLPDREARVDAFFVDPARSLPGRRFLLGGSGWHDRPLPGNVRYLGHVYTRDHNAANGTPLAVLNVSRESMARVGLSPATRLFEAAGAGACVITDAWDGIETFLAPGQEVLVARSGAEVVEVLGALTRETARRIGRAGRERLLAGHTYAHRAVDVGTALTGSTAAPLETAR
jgi:spore maturation protein CgeB